MTSSAPNAVPLLGHVPALLRDPLVFFKECARHHGDWASVRFGARPFFSATHPDLIEEVLVAKHRSFQKSPGLRRSSILFGDGLLTSEGDFWRKQRRLIQPAFHRDRIAGYAATMLETASAHLDGWRLAEPFDLHADLMRLTMDIAVQTLFGSRVTEMEVVANALEVGQKAFARWMHYLIMLPDWVPTPRAPGVSRAVRDLDRVVYGLIRARQASGEQTGDLLSMLLAVEDAETGDKMSEKQLRDEILTLFLAGHETTALTLTWTFYLLASNPKAQQQLWEELDRVLAGRTPTYDDASRLTYCDQVIRESMRLCPPAWIIGRQATEHVEIGGHTVPVGGSVIMPQYVVHRDPRFYDEPERFLPERWTPEFLRALPRFAYFPFGGGPRICIGSTFAMLESILLLAAIASRYRLTLAPGHQVVAQPAFTFRPRFGMWVVGSARRE